MLFRSGGPCLTGNAIRVAQFDPEWACAGQIEAMGDVNNEIRALAPVLNTQSYVWHFGPGLETMLKVSDGHAYVFAMTDGTAGARTFTLPGGLSGAEVEVLGEGRSIAIREGRFSDTFAAEHSYHIYKIRA